MLLLVPLYHLFGTEELSVHAPGIASLAAGPYLALGPRDAKQFMASHGDTVELTLDGQRFQCRMAIVQGLPPGVAGYPAGVPPLGSRTVPAFGSIVKRS